jgi:hypothetical protein
MYRAEFNASVINPNFNRRSSCSSSSNIFFISSKSLLKIFRYYTQILKSSCLDRWLNSLSTQFAISRTRLKRLSLLDSLIIQSFGPFSVETQLVAILQWKVPQFSWFPSSPSKFNAERSDFQYSLNLRMEQNSIHGWTNRWFILRIIVRQPFVDIIVSEI